MNNQITAYRISYFLFAIFISTIIVFVLHKGFKPIDAIMIPIFAIILFLIIDYSASIIYQQKIESFIIENLANGNIVEGFDIGGGPKGDGSAAPSQAVGDAASGPAATGVGGASSTAPFNPPTPTSPLSVGPSSSIVEPTNPSGKADVAANTTSSPSVNSLSVSAESERQRVIPTVSSESERQRVIPAVAQDIMKMRAPMAEESHGMNSGNSQIFKKFAAYEEEMPPKKDTGIPASKVIHMEEEQHFPKQRMPVVMQEEMVKKYPVMEEEMRKRPPYMEEEMRKRPPYMEEEMRKRPPYMEEEMKKPIVNMEEEMRKKAPMPGIGGESGKPAGSPSAGGGKSTPAAAPKSTDKKPGQAKKKESERPDINRFLMDDGRGLSNRNTGTLNPININVSYNNNQNLNDDRDTRPADLGKYQFDSGLEKKNTVSTAPGSLLNPVNPVTTNAALSNMNQRYYPAYLENPLNRYEPGTAIKSIFDEEERLQRLHIIQEENLRNGKILKEQKKFNQRANREILMRKHDSGKKWDDKSMYSKSGDSVINPNAWMQSNYETHMLKNILNEKNDPSPVLLDRPWSEWKSVDWNSGE